MADNNLPLPPTHHLLTAALVAIAIGVTWYFTKQHNEKIQQAIKETVTAEMIKIGASTQSKGHVVDYAEIERRLKESMGRDLLGEIKKTNGTIASLNTAVGEVKGEVKGLKETKTGSVNVTPAPDGSFSSLLQQNRGSLPSLTSINLDYKNQQLTGLWNNNTEVFTVGNTTWRTDNDGARAAVSLKRDVFTDAAKKNHLGKTEEIEIIDSNVFFPMSEIERISPIPKYTVYLGGSIDSKTGQKRIGGFITNHITKQIGITGGYINGGTMLGVSYTFGKK